MLNRVTPLLISILIFSSCEKQEEFINISINPSSIQEIQASDQIIPFTIRMSSNVDLSKLMIVEIINNSIIDTILDKTVSGLNKTEGWTYTCPNSSSNDTSDVKLIFSCYNIDGDYSDRTTVFSVISEDILLSETSGHTMYSTSSTGFNAYNLLTNTPADCHFGISHINDDWPSTSDTLTLSRKWTSIYAGLSFVKANSFDYANATSQDLQQIYESSIKKEFVDDIQADDIIITLIDNIYIAIKLIYVIDDVGVENDKYIFSIKK